MQRRSNTLRSPNVGNGAPLFEVSPELDVPLFLGVVLGRVFTRRLGSVAGGTASRLGAVA